MPVGRRNLERKLERLDFLQQRLTKPRLDRRPVHPVDTLPEPDPVVAPGDDFESGAFERLDLPAELIGREPERLAQVRTRMLTPVGDSLEQSHRQHGAISSPDRRNV